MQIFYVYIMASKTGTLYTGMTNNLKQRVHQHKNKLYSGFTAEYNINRLLYAESFTDQDTAVKREKQIKAWRREKKINLIDSINPQWLDLTDTL